MARLTTQPSASVIKPAIPLRSGFYAVPFLTSSSSTKENWIYVRSHKTGEDQGTDEEQNEVNKLFVTGLPYGFTAKSIKTTFTKLYPLNQIVHVELLTAATGSTTLYDHEVISSTAYPSVTPLFPSTSTQPFPSLSSSALITFSSHPTLPPSYSTPPILSTPTLPLYVNSASTNYALARPHLSTIISHSDSWMTAFDARRLTSAASALSTAFITHEIAGPSSSRELTSMKKGKKGKKGKKNSVDGPAPGSAAAALLAHTQSLANAANRKINPDQVVEEDWTFVSRGGKHGKSLLPTGAPATLVGYGGKTVKVAKAKKLGEEVEKGEMVEGMKMIVGEGFYRFRKDEKRREGE